MLKVQTKKSPSEKEIAYAYLVDGLSYKTLADRYHLSVSGVANIVRRYAGKVYTDFISSGKNMMEICSKYNCDVHTMRKILKGAERFYHIPICLTKID